MKLHQVILADHINVKYRDVSCSCEETPCLDHSLQKKSLKPWGTGLSKRKTQDKEKVETSADVEKLKTVLVLSESRNLQRLRLNSYNV